VRRPRLRVLRVHPCQRRRVLPTQSRRRALVLRRPQLRLARQCGLGLSQRLRPRLRLRRRRGELGLQSAAHPLLLRPRGTVLGVQLRQGDGVLGGQLLLLPRPRLHRQSVPGTLALALSLHGCQLRLQRVVQVRPLGQLLLGQLVRRLGLPWRVIRTEAVAEIPLRFYSFHLRFLSRPQFLGRRGRDVEWATPRPTLPAAQRGGELGVRQLCCAYRCRLRAQLCDGALVLLRSRRVSPHRIGVTPLRPPQRPLHLRVRGLHLLRARASRCPDQRSARGVSVS
jgi:hypothetical protein